MIVAMWVDVAILIGCNFKDVVESVVMLLCECKGATCMGMGVDEHCKNCKESKECLGTL
jgi:hypothetical protein